MIVQTMVQANELNLAGTYGPYRAANGHTMIAPLRWPQALTCPHPNHAGDPERVQACDEQFVTDGDYHVNDTIQYDSFAAECAPGCAACRDGEPLEDW